MVYATSIPAISFMKIILQYTIIDYWGLDGAVVSTLIDSDLSGLRPDPCIMLFP